MPPSSPAGPVEGRRFDDAKVAFLAGLAAHEAGRPADAEGHYLASLAALPARVSTLVNLAAVRLALARPGDALAAADAALAQDVNAADAWLHRATALAALDRLEEAVAGFERLDALVAAGGPDGAATRIESLRRRAPLLERLSRPLDALATYRQLLEMAPRDAQAWSVCGGLLRELGRPAEAASAFKAAIRAGADPELQAFYLSAVGAAPAPVAPPAAYVAGLFDSYADGFDSHLVEQLHYQAHRRLVDGAAAAGLGPHASALDLGCGTGLVGALLRPAVARLTGIDLSPRMVAAARTRGIYDCLVQADLVDFLAATDERYDLVLAADVLIYVGELGPLFAAVRRVLPRGLFGFSVERAADPDAAFQLLPSLRYAHGERAIRRLAQAHGWQVWRIEPGTIREDQRRPIVGDYVWLKPV